MKVNKIQQFHNAEFGGLDVLVIDDKPYFPATECAKILGYSEPQNAVNRHCKIDGCVKHTVIDRLGREQKTKFITEGNLYRLIIRSKLPAADKFERWVFDEVLPSIRKHGAYITGETLDRIMQNSEYSTLLIQELQRERVKNEAILEHICEIAPKARYYDVILQSKNTVPITLIAKDYGMSAALFNKLLHALGIQYKLRDTWVLYQPYSQKGYTVSYTHHINAQKSVMHTYWTQKGRFFIYELFCYRGGFML